MIVHRAWFCSDIVKNVSSYLPVADVFSIMGCGNRRIIKLLLDEAEYCLVITTRDMDAVCRFLTLFRNTRYVFAKGDRDFGDAYAYTGYTNSTKPWQLDEMPRKIERFVAPDSYIHGISFGPNLKYITSQYTMDCEFEVAPEKCVNLSGEYVDEYVTHVVTDNMCGEILEFTEETPEVLYPQLQEIDVRQCVPDDEKVISKRINIIYTCSVCGIDKNVCMRCGSKVNEAFVSKRDLSKYDGISSIKLARNDFIPSTFPSSATTVQICSEKDISGVIKCLPKTVTTLDINQISVPSELICNINPEIKTITARMCSANSLDVVKLIALNCHKLQFDIMTMAFEHVNSSFPREYIDMLAGNYHMTINFSCQLIFERIRACN